MSRDWSSSRERVAYVLKWPIVISSLARADPPSNLAAAPDAQAGLTRCPILPTGEQTLGDLCGAFRVRVSLSVSMAGIEWLPWAVGVTNCVTTAEAEWEHHRYAVRDLDAIEA